METQKNLINGLPEKIVVDEKTFFTTYDDNTWMSLVQKIEQAGYILTGKIEMTPDKKYYASATKYKYLDVEIELAEKGSLYALNGLVENYIKEGYFPISEIANLGDRKYRKLAKISYK